MEECLEKLETRKTMRSGRGWVVVFMSLAAAVFVGILVIAFLTSLVGKAGGEQFPKVYFLLTAAILGALVNQPFRNTEENAIKGPSLLILYLAWKCAVASVFAIVANLIFISGVISGELFPEFAGTSMNYVDIVQWALVVDPKTNADMAKMLIWGFVAGYSEKLIPNMVAKIFVIPK